MQRLAIIVYRLLRAIAVLTTLYGWWIAYWAPDNKIVVFMIYFAPALLIWFAATFVRFILGGFGASSSAPDRTSGITQIWCSQFCWCPDF